MTLTDLFAILYQLTGLFLGFVFLLMLVRFFASILLSAKGGDRGRGDGGEW